VQFCENEIYKTVGFAKSKHLKIFKTMVFLETKVFSKYFEENNAP
jgi:hypothetical protein